MSSNPLILQCSPSEGGNPQVVVDALIPQIIMSGAAAIAQQAVDLAKENIAILGGALATAGLAILLPSLIVVIVNAIGFTAAGVLKASLAASIQSGVYGAWTTGIFSVLQAFGATAAVAPPATLALGGTFLAVGVGQAGLYI